MRRILHDVGTGMWAVLAILATVVWMIGPLFYAAAASIAGSVDLMLLRIACGFVWMGGWSFALAMWLERKGWLPKHGPYCMPPPPLPVFPARPSTYDRGSADA